MITIAFAIIMKAGNIILPQKVVKMHITMENTLILIIFLIQDVMESFALEHILGNLINVVMDKC